MNIALFQKKVGDEKGQPLTHSKRHKLITKKERLKEDDTLSPQQVSQLFKHIKKLLIQKQITLTAVRTSAPDTVLKLYHCAWVCDVCRNNFAKLAMLTMPNLACQVVMVCRTSVGLNTRLSEPNVWNQCLNQKQLQRYITTRFAYQFCRLHMITDFLNIGVLQVLE